MEGRSSGKSPRFPCSFWGRNGVRWVVGGAGANFAPSGTCSKHHAYFPIRRALAHSAPSRSPRSRCCTWRGGSWLPWTRGCRTLIWSLKFIPQASSLDSVFLVVVFIDCLTIAIAVVVSCRHCLFLYLCRQHPGNHLPRRHASGIQASSEARHPSTSRISSKRTLSQGSHHLVSYSIGNAAPATTNQGNPLYQQVEWHSSSLLPLRNLRTFSRPTLDIRFRRLR